LSGGPQTRARDLAQGRSPAWAQPLAWLYWIAAAGLAPWIVYLFLTQVKRSPAHQVHILAVGLVLAMMAGLLTTAWLYARDSWLSVMAASFTATATFISAWFRILTKTGARPWVGSLLVFVALVTAVIVLCVIAIRADLATMTEATHPGPGKHVRWLPAVLVLAALALVPSVIIAGTVGPGVQIAKHLRVAWTGLDVCELLAMAHTGSALFRRSAMVAIPATVTGTLLLCDAWINIIPSTALAQAEGIAMAFVEVPIAAISFWVASRAMSFVAGADPGAR